MNVPAAATGVGSMPGTSVAEAVAVVTGELLELPHLPELPRRGAGADLVGRAAALLLGVSRDFALTTVAARWQISGQVGPDMRRARSWLGEDCDRLEQALGASEGFVKTQVCGPWTWAAAVEDRAGRRLVRDESFVTDLTHALSEAIVMHVADLRRRLPGREVIVQIDEPGLPAVLDGRIPTASGMGRLAAVPAARAAAHVRDIVATVPAPVIMHCCDTYPFGVAAAADVAGVSWDLVQGADPDAVAECFEAGRRLFVGAVGTGDTAAASHDRFAALWQRTGLGTTAAAEVGITPSCGLVGESPAGARAALAAAVEVRRRLADG